MEDRKPSCEGGPLHCESPSEGYREQRRAQRNHAEIGGRGRPTGGAQLGAAPKPSEPVTTSHPRRGPPNAGAGGRRARKFWCARVVGLLRSGRCKNGRGDGEPSTEGRPEGQRRFPCRRGVAGCGGAEPCSRWGEDGANGGCILALSHSG